MSSFVTRQCTRADCRLRFPVAADSPLGEHCPHCGGVTEIDVRYDSLDARVPVLRRHVEAVDPHLHRVLGLNALDVEAHRLQLVAERAVGLQHLAEQPFEHRPLRREGGHAECDSTAAAHCVSYITKGEAHRTEGRPNAVWRRPISQRNGRCRHADG